MPRELIINTDGGARGNPGPAGIGVMVIDEHAQPVFQQGMYIGHATNNEAEYKAVLASLEWLKTAPFLSELHRVEWKLDSLLVVEQLSRHWKIKEARLQQLATMIWQQLSLLPCTYTFTHVPRAQNAQADALVNQALDAAAL